MNFIQVLTSLAGRARPPVERRNHERRPAHERAVVCWKDHVGLPKAHSITIVNVSINGIAFASPDELPEGQAITVITASRSLDCVVRHVRKTGRGYYLGAEAISITAGDEETSAPRTLTEGAGDESGDQ